MTCSAIGRHEGVLIQEYQGKLSDDACTVLRHIVIEEFGFDPGKEPTRDAAQTLAIQNPFHPVRDYLDNLRWDGQARLDRWMTTYLGAEDTPLSATIGRIVLMAAVRRVREPGVKFDTILVLEGEQGIGKSTAIRILAGPANFSDQNILTLDGKAQMELLEGVWFYEICELEGLSRAETSKVKAFASRAVDQGRPAYGRFKETRFRQTVFIGTTNDDKYLRDMTGNRRFWPVKVGKIDLEAFSATATNYSRRRRTGRKKANRSSCPKNSGRSQRSEQEERLEDDPWADAIAHIHPSDRRGGRLPARLDSQALGTEPINPPGPTTAVSHQATSRRNAEARVEGTSFIKMKNGLTVRGYQSPMSKTRATEQPDPKTLPPTTNRQTPVTCVTCALEVLEVGEASRRATEAPRRASRTSAVTCHDVLRPLSASGGCCVAAPVLEPLGPLSNPDPRLVERGVGARGPSTGGSLRGDEPQPVVVRGVAGGRSGASVTAVVPDRRRSGFRSRSGSCSEARRRLRQRNNCRLLLARVSVFIFARNDDMALSINLTRRVRRRKLKSGAVVDQTRYVLNWRDPRTGDARAAVLRAAEGCAGEARRADRRVRSRNLFRRAQDRHRRRGRRGVARDQARRRPPDHLRQL